MDVLVKSWIYNVYQTYLYCNFFQIEVVIEMNYILRLIKTVIIDINYDVRLMNNGEVNCLHVW